MTRRVAPSPEVIAATLRFPEDTEDVPLRARPVMNALRFLAKEFKTTHTVAKRWLIAASQADEVTWFIVGRDGAIDSMLEPSKDPQYQFQRVLPHTWLMKRKGEEAHRYITAHIDSEGFYVRPGDKPSFGWPSGDSTRFVAASSSLEAIMDDAIRVEAGNVAVMKAERQLDEASVRVDHGEDLAVIEELLRRARTEEALKDLYIRATKFGPYVTVTLRGKELELVAAVLRQVGIVPTTEGTE